MKAAVTLILGTGALAAFPEARASATRTTPCGAASWREWEQSGLRLLLLPRHGRDHDCLPHRINHRAHLWALREAGVEFVLATAAVGSLNSALPPGSLAALSDFLDFTRAGPHTFAGHVPRVDEEVAEYHADFSEPYDRAVRQAILEAAEAAGIPLAREAVYAGVDGPRYETPAEIRMFRRLGADVVGMTGVPEAVLARELGLRYASLALVTNWAAGLAGPLSHAEVEAGVSRLLPRARAVLLGAAALLTE